MRLYLVHHAEAKKEDEDPARPLAEKGWQDARKVARYVAERVNLQLDRIFHSGMLRAQQTASVWTEHVRNMELIQADGLDPLADPEVWAKRLAAETGAFMLVGHFPHLARLAARLLCGHDGEMLAPLSGGVACLERNPAGHWTLRWILTPEVI